MAGTGSSQVQKSSKEQSVDDVVEGMACPVTTRIPLLKPGTETPEVTEIYDECNRLYGMIPKFYQLLAHAPATARSWLAYDKDIKVSALRNGEVERSRYQVLGILKPSLDNECHNCAHHNVDLARKLGFSDSQLATIKSGTWHDNDEFTDKEKAVLDWADRVTHMTARDDDKAFKAMQDHFTTEEIVELTYTISLWNCSNRFAEALHLTAEPPGQGIKWWGDK